MMSVALSTIGDQGLVFNKASVDLNDVLAVKQMLKSAGVNVKLLDRDSIEEANNYDALLLKCGVIVNWGGKQSEHLKKIINVVNEFDGPVFLMSVDQDFVLPNKERDGFLTINRPVSFLYSGKNASEVVSKQLPDIEVEDSIQFYQGVQIGKQISKLPFVNTKPVYDAVYGGQPRKELLSTLNDIAENYSLLVYENVRKKVPNAISADFKMFFDNKELRAINSLGKFSFLFYKPKTPWITPRIFEQLCSNSFALFDKCWEATKPFWTDNNTFSSEDELIERMGQEPTENEIKEQHQIAKEFDYDKYNEEQLAHLLPLLEK